MKQLVKAVVSGLNPLIGETRAQRWGPLVALAVAVGVIIAGGSVPTIGGVIEHDLVGLLAAFGAGAYAAEQGAE